MNKKIIIAYRVFFALLALAAILTQLLYSTANVSGFNAVNFFSYFTIESNILALAVFLVGAKAAYTGEKGRTLDVLRGAATLYMTITGVIYGLLLSGVDVNVPLPWVNLVLHYVFPLVIFIDWLIDRASNVISAKIALAWLAYPLAYFAYSLIRGHYVGWYPYPFMNADKIGYGSVAINAVFIAIGMVLLALVIARVSRFSGLTDSTEATQPQTKRVTRKH